MKIGILQETKLQGKRIILEPRQGLEDNLYWVEKGEFINGSPHFALYCLICEKEVPGRCLDCNKKDFVTSIL